MTTLNRTLSSQTDIYKYENVTDRHCSVCIITRQNLYNSLLGFHSKLYTSGFHEYENMVNILIINSIVVSTDIISGGYVIGSTQPTIYSFFRNVSPGHKIIENPHNLLDLPITADTIHSITVWLTDQNGNELNLRGENLLMRLHLREI